MRSISALFATALALLVAASCSGPYEQLMAKQAEVAVASTRFVRDDAPEGSEDVALIWQVRSITAAFRVPLCFEWPFVEEADGMQVVRSAPRVPFVIQKGQRLDRALADLIANTQDALEVRTLHDVLSLVSAKTDGVDCLLDESVSLSLKQATTWEALRKLLKALNRRPPEGRTRHFRVKLDCMTTLQPPPPELDQSEDITLDLQDVTAREALCAIISQSSLEMAYRYTNYNPSPDNDSVTPRREGDVTINFYEDGRLRVVHRGMDSDVRRKYLFEGEVMYDEDAFWGK